MPYSTQYGAKQLNLLKLIKAEQLSLMVKNEASDPILFMNSSDKNQYALLERLAHHLEKTENTESKKL